MLFRFSNHRFHVIQPTFLNIFISFLPIGLLLHLFVIFFKPYFNHYLTMLGLDSISQVRKQEILPVLLIQIICISLHLFLDFLSHWDQYKIQLLIQNLVGGSLYSIPISRIIVMLPIILLTFLGLLFLYQKCSNMLWKIIKLKGFASDLTYLSVLSLIIFLFRFICRDADTEYPIDVMIIVLSGSILQAFLLLAFLRTIQIKYAKK